MCIKNLASIIFISGSLFFISNELLAGKNEETHTQLREIGVIYEKAIVDNNLDILKPYFSPDISIIMFTDREFTDFEEFKRQWNISRDKFLEGGSYRLELNPEVSQIVGDVAIARGNANNYVTKGNGDEIFFTSHWTAIAQNINGQWKILRIHVSMDPFTNQFVKNGVQNVLIKVGLGVFLLGVAAGFILFKIVTGRKKA